MKIQSFWLLFILALTGCGNAPEKQPDQSGGRPGDDRPTTSTTRPNHDGQKGPEENLPINPPPQQVSETMDKKAFDILGKAEKLSNKN